MKNKTKTRRPNASQLASLKVKTGTVAGRTNEPEMK